MHHRASDECPTRPRAITWTSVKSQAAFEACVSKSDVIRFRVVRGPAEVIFDGDWYSTNWALTPEATASVFKFCEGKARSISGGTSCLRIKTTPEHSREVTEGLARILSGPKAWDRLTVKPRFPKNSFQVFDDAESEEWDYSALLSQPKFDEAATEKLAARAELGPAKPRRGMQLKHFSGAMSKLGTRNTGENIAKQ
jgi:hypothetical protein